MKKLWCVLTLGLAFGASLAAQEDALPPSPLVVNYGVSMGFFTAPASTDPWANVIPILDSLATLRGGVEAQFTLPLGKFVWAGVGAGAYTMSFGEGSSQVVSLDLPLRAVAKLGLDTSFAEVFGGYYWSLLPADVALPIGGPESGVRLALEGWYFEASVVWSSTIWTRYGLGFVSALR